MMVDMTYFCRFNSRAGMLCVLPDRRLCGEAMGDRCVVAVDPEPSRQLVAGESIESNRNYLRDDGDDE